MRSYSDSFNIRIIKCSNGLIIRDDYNDLRSWKRMVREFFSFVPKHPYLSIGILRVSLVDLQPESLTSGTLQMHFTISPIFQREYMEPIS